jgi:uncharacterized protein involved in oxidation of intracellular sulfur
VLCCARAISAGGENVSKLNEGECHMKVAMVICQDTPEVIWNAFRLGNMMLEGMDDVSIFLNGPSVRYEESDSQQFPLKELARIFTLSEGQLFA